MNKLVLLFVMLLLVSVVGCSTTDNAVGPDTSDQVQTDDTAQKPAVPHEPPGDPDSLGDDLNGPRK